MALTPTLKLCEVSLQSNKVLFNNTKSFVVISFTMMSFILATLIIFWIQSVHVSEERLQEVIKEQEELKLINKMREISYKRSMSILRMAIMDDVIDRSDEFNDFRFLASDFLSSRDRLLKDYLSENQYKEWLVAREHIKKSQTLQNSIAREFMSGNEENGKRLILNSGFNVQYNTRSALEDLAITTENEIKHVTEDAIIYGKNIYVLIFLLTAVAIGIGIVIARYVIQKTAKYEASIIDTSVNVRRLYSLSAETGLTIEQQVQRMLTMGCEMLGMKEGYINKFESNSQEFVVINACLNDEYVKPGNRVNIKDSLCGFTYSTDHTLAINDVSESEFREFCVAEDRAVNAYIATSFIIKGNKYGTLSFASDRSRQACFSNADIDLIKLMASWISFALERSMDNQALIKLKDRAEQANNAKSEFLGNMSHELRTPMHAILSYANFGVKRFNKVTDEKKLSYFSKIQNSANNLLGLLNNILDLAKLESGKLEMEKNTCNFYMLVMEVFDEVKSLCEEKNIKLILNEKCADVQVSIDSERIKQVMMNLVGNAIKFSPDNSSVLADFDVLDDSLTFKISDQGPGIPVDEIHGIFDKFIQSSKTKTGAGGTGLGLSICRQIIAAHHGEIWANNISAGGAVFYFSIPVSSFEDNIDITYNYA